MTAGATRTGGASAPVGVSGLDHLGTLLLETGAISEDQARIALTSSRTPGPGLRTSSRSSGSSPRRSSATPSAGPSGWRASTSAGRCRARCDGGGSGAGRAAVSRRRPDLARDEGGAPRRLTVAMADPFDVIALDHLRSLFDGAVEIVPFLAGRSDVERFLGTRLPPRSVRRRDPARGSRPAKPTRAASRRTPTNTASRSSGSSTCCCPTRVQRGASDIHFEPEAGSCASAIGSTACCARSGASTETTGRHRGASQGDVRHEHRRDAGPQDGRMTLSVSGHDIDYRVVLPSYRARREHRTPRARSEPRDRGPGRAGHVAPRARGAPANDGTPGGRDPGDRADGQRQDHHPLLDPGPPRPRGDQHHDPRGPGRVPDEPGSGRRP